METQLTPRRTIEKFIWAVALVALFAMAVRSQPLVSRVKDIAQLDGIQDNVLIGFGLVGGLDGTGDGRRGFTAQTLNNLLAGLDINVMQPDAISTEVIPDNVASVIVLANLPPFARPGTRIDCSVFSIGRAQSLQGGTLIATPLKGADGKIHGVAYGPVSIGGFKITAGGGGGGAAVQENHTLAGMIPNGCIVEGEPVIHSVIQENNALRWLLFNPDFKTASNLQRRINSVSGMRVAVAEDAAAVRVHLRPSQSGDILLGEQAFESLVDVIAFIDDLLIETDEPAKIIINERTGTVIAGQNIRVRNVVVAHGALRITIQTTPEVTPGGFAADVAPVVTADTAVTAEQGDKVALINGTTVGEVVASLNTIGIKPQDLITILQMMQAAGAIKAQIEMLQ